MASVEEIVAAHLNRTSVVGIVGMGYVGLPLAVEFTKKGFKVLGFDIDPTKVEMLMAGKSYIRHIPEASISGIRARDRFQATTDFSRISETHSVLICVPTPLGDHWEPDISYIESTGRAIAPYLRPGHLVVLESTTYPGTTEEVLLPILEQGSGLTGGVDLHLAFSPEREDPNNPEFTTSTIPKVVGGMSPDSLAIAKSLYDQIVTRTVPVSSCAVAEAAKLLENIFRSVNIALVNELKIIFSKMAIDVWEVIEAAKSKPFGFMPFYPGPGLGGHCIPIDPFYLTWKAREYGVVTRFIELAGEINTSMPAYIVDETMRALNGQKKALNGTRVLIVGLAYKADVDDMRESPSLRLIELFEEKGAEVGYYDPYIPVIPPTREHGRLTGRKSIELSDAGSFDVAVISTRHTKVNHKLFAEKCGLVIDTRNALQGMHGNVHRA
jgi:UDP-N-acetyl-D-glucosamine dehydrogenase